MDIRFVDCRYELADATAARTGYLAGHVPGAAFLDLEVDLSDLSVPAEVSGRHPLPSARAFAAAAGRAGIGPDTLVVAYDTGMNGGAARLWWLLRHFGHEHVGVLDGGLDAWLGPLAQGGERIAPAVFTPRERSDDVVTTEELAERLGDPRLVLLDARSAERFGGEPSPLDPGLGHIPGARSVPYTLGPTVPDDVLDAQELACYCGSGVTACVTLLALHRAGRSDARLYPGSWSEWARRGLPAETG